MSVQWESHSPELQQLLAALHRMQELEGSLDLDAIDAAWQDAQKAMQLIEEFGQMRMFAGVVRDR